MSELSKSNSITKYFRLSSTAIHSQITRSVYNTHDTVDEILRGNILTTLRASRSLTLIERMFKVNNTLKAFVPHSRNVFFLTYFSFA